MGAMAFSMRDLYPTMGFEETSTNVIPDVNNQEALAENKEDVDNAHATKTARKKNIFIAMGLMLALVVFFGVQGGR